MLSQAAEGLRHPLLNGCAVVFLLGSFLSPGMAQEAPTPAVASWAWQMEELTKWLADTRGLVPTPEECEPPCYVLDTLALRGSVEDGELTFTLTGSVIADRAVLVPLVGPVSRVILQDVKVNDRPAVVGFAPGDHYYVRTAERSLVVKGRIVLPGEPTLAVPGPVNAVLADLGDGRIVEGDRLSGVQDATLHLERRRPEAADRAVDEAPIFQISRAVRVEQEVSFEYRLLVRSGSEIPSVSLALPHGERVLDVPGRPGWKQEGRLLVIPAAGRQVELTVLGRLPQLGELAPDERSAFEWWLLESDAEHRLSVETAARQVDSSESPLPRRLPSSKLFLVAPGQTLRVSAQALANLEALAAVIRSQERFVVWTEKGHLVAQDTVSYENSGLDYLGLDVRGKPLYFAEDGRPAKILAEDPSAEQRVLVPLRKGTHTATVQSLSFLPPSWLFGVLDVPAARHGLTTSRATVTLGVPSRIIPLWITGGEGFESPIGVGHALAAAVALLVALLLFRGRGPVLAGTVALAGLFVIARPLFGLVVAAVALSLIVRIIVRRAAGSRRWIYALGAAAASIVLLFAVLVLMRLGQSRPRYPAQEAMLRQVETAPAPEAEEARFGQRADDLDERLGNVLLQDLATVQGVVGVALPMPSYARRLRVDRELVTDQEPLEPVLVYATRAAAWPLGLVWLWALGSLAWLHRRLIASWAEKIRTTVQGEASSES